MNTKADKKVKIIRVIGMMLIVSVILTTTAFASVNYGEKAGTWILENLSPIAIIAAIVLVGNFVMQRNLTKAVISFVVACVVIFLINVPETFKTVGTAIGSAILS